MAHRIEVDDEVYAKLEQYVQGFEQPNDVLRRLLLGDSAIIPRDRGSPSQGGSRTLKNGRLKPLIEAGLVQVGDELRCEQVRKGATFVGFVGAGGLTKTDKGSYEAPSPALAELVGTQIDGWANWIHVPSGKSLKQLRASLSQ